VLDNDASGGVDRRVVDVGVIGEGHDAMVEGELQPALSTKIDAATVFGEQDGNDVGLRTSRGNMLDHSGGSGTVGWAVDV
ncbi:hypothetical protein HN51_032737, partial [Arachis hypogaea]